MAKKRNKKLTEDFLENLAGMIDNEGFEYYFTSYTGDVFKDIDPKLWKLEKAFVKAHKEFEDAVNEILSQEYREGEDEEDSDHFGC